MPPLSLPFAISTTVSAAVVCNEEGDCWRVREERNYEPSLKLRVMQPDDWRWKEGERYRWREPGRGHGYFRDGVWIVRVRRRPPCGAVSHGLTPSHIHRRTTRRKGDDRAGGDHHAA
jgi:hypothetical protein